MPLKNVSSYSKKYNKKSPWKTNFIVEIMKKKPPFETKICTFGKKSKIVSVTIKTWYWKTKNILKECIFLQCFFSYIFESCDFFDTDPKSCPWKWNLSHENYNFCADKILTQPVKKSWKVSVKSMYCSWKISILIKY